MRSHPIVGVNNHRRRRRRRRPSDNNSSSSNGMIPRSSDTQSSPGYGGGGGGGGGEESIRVVVRVRPPTRRERTAMRRARPRGSGSPSPLRNSAAAAGPVPLDNRAVEVLGSGKSIQVLLGRTRGEELLDPNAQRQAKVFRCNQCFEEDCGQERMFEECGVTTLVKSTLHGYATTVFAYGQTGAGKTHSMFGDDDAAGLKHVMKPRKRRRADAAAAAAAAVTEHEGEGVLPRSIRKIFAGIDRLRAGAAGPDAFMVRVSCMEIYNDQVVDLLSEQPQQQRFMGNRAADDGGDAATATAFAAIGGGGVLTIRSHPKEGFFVDGLRVLPCANQQQVFAAAHRAAVNRRIASHNLNARSNRSHCMITIHIDRRDRGTGPSGGALTRFGRMTFVDLAGSERLKATAFEGEKGANGGVQTKVKEAGHINKSLYVLGKVIKCLNFNDRQRSRRDKKVVPFRDSALTKLLAGSLGGSSRTLLIACVGCMQSTAGESLSTLQFAMGCKNIRGTPAVILNANDKLIKNLKDEISRLRLENSQLRQTQPLSPPRRHYLDGGDDEPGIYGDMSFDDDRERSMRGSRDSLSSDDSEMVSPHRRQQQQPRRRRREQDQQQHDRSHRHARPPMYEHDGMSDDDQEFEGGASRLPALHGSAAARSPPFPTSKTPKQRKTPALPRVGDGKQPAGPLSDALFDSLVLTPPPQMQMGAGLAAMANAAPGPGADAGLVLSQLESQLHEQMKLAAKRGEVAEASPQSNISSAANGDSPASMQSMALQSAMAQLEEMKALRQAELRSEAAEEMALKHGAAGGGGPLLSSSSSLRSFDGERRRVPERKEEGVEEEFEEEEKKEEEIQQEEKRDERSLADILSPSPAHGGPTDESFDDALLEEVEAEMTVARQGEAAAVETEADEGRDGTGGGGADDIYDEEEEDDYDGDDFDEDDGDEDDDGNDDDEWEARRHHQVHEEPLRHRHRPHQQQQQHHAGGDGKKSPSPPRPRQRYHHPDEFDDDRFYSDDDDAGGGDGLDDGYRPRHTDGGGDYRAGPGQMQHRSQLDRLDVTEGAIRRNQQQHHQYNRHGSFAPAGERGGRAGQFESVANVHTNRKNLRRMKASKRANMERLERKAIKKQAEMWTSDWINRNNEGMRF